MKRIFTIMAAALLLASCEKQIDIDIEDMESQVVVQAQGETGTPVALNLTYSRPTFGYFYVYNGEDYFPSVTDATVSLSVDGGAAETAVRDGGTYSFSHIPQPGEELSLSIAVPGKDPVSAKATVPLLPQVGDIYVTTRQEQPDIDYNTSVDISVFVPLSDRDGSADYYSIILYRRDTVVYTYYDDNGAVIDYDTLVDSQDWFECQDQLVVTDIDMEDALEGVALPSFFGSEMLFTDARINGTTHSIELLTNVHYGNYWYYGQYPNDNGEYTENFTYEVHCTFHVEVSALSRDLYLYRQTMNSYDDDELLSFFSEPVQIHSNIDGGIGIFGVSSKKSLTYRMDFSQQ